MWKPKVFIFNFYECWNVQEESKETHTSTCNTFADGTRVHEIWPIFGLLLTSIACLWTIANKNLFYNVVLHCRRTEDCYSPWTEYLGATATTVTGKVCQRWDSQFPHNHTYSDQPTAVDNHCRDYDHPKPWCYTLDHGKRWEDCDVPRCREYSDFLTIQNFRTLWILVSLVSRYTCIRNVNFDTCL